MCSYILNINFIYVNLNSIFIVVTGSQWLADKYFRRQEMESVEILAIANTGEFPVHSYCPESPSKKTLILLGLSCRTPAAVCAEGACAAAARCRGCEGLRKTLGRICQCHGSCEATTSSTGLEGARSSGTRRGVISDTGKKEKGSEEEHGEMKNQSTRAKGKQGAGSRGAKAGWPRWEGSGAAPVRAAGSCVQRSTAGIGTGKGILAACLDVPSLNCLFIAGICPLVLLDSD